MIVLLPLFYHITVKYD